MKRAFKIKWKAFFIICKELSLKQIKRIFFGRWESDFNKRKVQPPFIDNIWDADLADMQLYKGFNFSKGFRLLLCTNDIYRKYT